MRIISTTKSFTVELSVVEVNDPIALKHCTNRFNVVLIKNNQKLFPKKYHKFLEFENNDYIYHLESKVINKRIQISPILFHELMLCDKSLEDCTTLINDLLLDTNKITAIYNIYNFNEKQND